MSGLVEKLEAAEVGSRVFDRLIGDATESPMGWSGDVVGLGYPHFTTSLDAALALARHVRPEVSPGVSRNVFHGYWSAWLHQNADGACHLVGEACTAPTPALALCIAICRALNLNETRHAE